MRCPRTPGSPKVVYRRYASLYVLAGVDAEDNVLGALELVQAYVEALDKFFGAVCELDIMFHLEKAHYILDEMLMNGEIVECNRAKVLQPVQQLEQSSNSGGGVGGGSPQVRPGGRIM